MQSQLTAPTPHALRCRAGGGLGSVQDRFAYRRRGFTLVELLVIIGIIVVLLAIFSPSLHRAIESSRRGVCAAHQAQTYRANVGRASDRDDHLVDGKPVLRSNTSGHFNVWHRNWSRPAPDPWSDYGRYGMHGVLAKQGYTDAKSFYCPSIKLHNRGFAGDKQGWFNKQSSIPSDQDLIHTSYVYNSTIGSDKTLNMRKWRSPRLSDPAGTAMLTDWFGSHPPKAQYNVDYHHGDGYNVTYVDGSTSFFEDPDRVIFNLNDGNPYFSGADNYKYYISRAWRIFSGLE